VAGKLNRAAQTFLEAICAAEWPTVLLVPIMMAAALGLR
jgi:hypothetical protein